MGSCDTTRYVASNRSLMVVIEGNAPGFHLFVPCFYAPLASFAVLLGAFCCGKLVRACCERCHVAQLHEVVLDAVQHVSRHAHVVLSLRGTCGSVRAVLLLVPVLSGSAVALCCVTNGAAWQRCARCCGSPPSSSSSSFRTAALRLLAVQACQLSHCACACCVCVLCV